MKKSKFVWEPFELVGNTGSGYHLPVNRPGDDVEAECWVNNLYQVLLRRHKSTNEDQCDMVHLSIRTIDREADHDWRHFQRIKNELLGEEIEAVEMYPAETRLVDTSNQYHLWAFDDPNFRFPFGYADRLVTEGNKGNTRQRPFQDGFKPEDCRKLNEL